VVDADWVAATDGAEAFISAQNEYSWLTRDVEQELVPALEHTGQGLLPFFPLASGLLTGKYRRGEAAADGTRLAKMPARLEGADWDRIEALASYAEKHGVSMLDVAIGGLAAMPTVASVIAGATSVEQVRANAAAGTWQPDAEQLRELVSLTA
jgi:aryl-alcohol dehydrogenase-like predicted oxidoreductase